MYTSGLLRPADVIKLPNSISRTIVSVTTGRSSVLIKFSALELVPSQGHYVKKLNKRNWILFTARINAGHAIYFYFYSFMFGGQKGPKLDPYL